MVLRVPLEHQTPSCMSGDPAQLRAAQAERESFGRLLLGPEQCGFVDAFRARHPGVTAYTYWDHKTRARERNSGWRLDYCLVRPAWVPVQHHMFLTASCL